MMYTSCIDALNDWIGSVNRGELEAVLKLYNANATLLPTYSARLVDSRAGLRDYFVEFTAKPNLKARLDEDSLRVCRPAETIVVATGFYTFTFGLAGRTRTVPARFTFVLDLADAAPILHHHSSELPVSPDAARSQ